MTTKKSRPYHRSGTHSVQRALPYLLARIKCEGSEESPLTPLEEAARDWRNDVLADLGGPEAVSATKQALLDAALGTWLVLSSLDAYLLRLAEQDGLVNKRNRRAFSIVVDRQRVADSLTKQLAALGFERVPKPPKSIEDYIRERAAAREGYGQAEPSPASAGATDPGNTA